MGQSESFSYDIYGHLISRTDKDGLRTEYKRDMSGKLLNVRYADGREASYNYDLIGNISSVEDWLGTTRFESDAAGRILNVVDFEDRSVSYSYGDGNERRSIKYPDGHEVFYDYDDQLRIKKIIDGNDHIGYEFDEAGRLKEKIFPNGSSLNYSYFAGGKVSELIARDAEGITDHYRYSYAANGDLMEIVRDRRDLDAVSGVFSYKYDELGHLIETLKDGERIEAFNYDPFGNRISAEDARGESRYYYDSLNRLTGSETLSGERLVCRAYDYDCRGNLMTVHENGEVRKSYRFNAEGKLETATDSEMGTSSYSYNALGQRVSSKKQGEETTYLCDLTRGCYNLLEMNVNGKEERFVYDGNIVSLSNAQGNYYYMNDELGSPMRLTGTDGTIAESYAFNSFGDNIDPYTGTVRRKGYRKEGNILQPFAFTGYQEDEVSGLDFAQARYYSSESAAFVSEDPIKSGENWYCYASGKPTTIIDPLGLMDEECFLYDYLFGGNRWGLPYINKRTAAFTDLFKLITKLGILDPLFDALDFERVDGHFHVNVNKYSNQWIKDLLDFLNLTDLATNIPMIDSIINDPDGHFCWQQPGGYNDLYDFIFHAFCSMDRGKIVFEAGGEKYTLWYWKGEYLNLGLGGECGLYKGDGYDDTAVWITGQEIPMTMHLDYGNGVTYDYSSTTWWITDFYPAYQYKSAEDVTITYEVDLSSMNMSDDEWKKFIREYASKGEVEIIGDRKIRFVL